jgi:uncharacterized OsmC-like protein
MSSDPAVSATTTDTVGRFVLTARQVHVVTDASVARGGPAEALQAAELLLGSLATCGLALITDAARKRESALTGATARASYTVDPQDRTRFSILRLHFSLAGVARGEAEVLVQAFTDGCPIYNTIVRTTPAEITVETD